VLESLSENRIGVSANCLGMARGAFEASLEFAKTRIVRGKPIIEYQAIAHKLADMAADIEAAKWLVYYGAWRVDQGTIDAATASKVKLVASEMAVRVTEQAIRIHGGAGIIARVSGRAVPPRLAGLCHRRGHFRDSAQYHLAFAELIIVIFGRFVAAVRICCKATPTRENTSVFSMIFLGRLPVPTRPYHPSSRYPGRRCGAVHDGARPCVDLGLPIPRRFTTIRQINASGGFMSALRSSKFPAWFDARNGAVGLDVARREQGLYPRAAAGLHRRCDAPVQRLHSGRGPHHGLHGPKKIAALARLPAHFRSEPSRSVGSPRRSMWEDLSASSGNAAKAVSAKPKKPKSPPSRPPPDRGAAAAHRIALRAGNAVQKLRRKDCCLKRRSTSSGELANSAMPRRRYLRFSLCPDSR